MIDLGIEEKILKAFEVKKSPHGKGVFYITNLRVVLETQQYDTVLDLSFNFLTTYKNISRDSFRIEWIEENQHWHYEFKVQRSAKEVFESYAIANKEFSEASFESDILKHVK